MTRFWLEFAIAFVEVALILRLVWLIVRSHRWDRRYHRLIQDKDYKANLLWLCYRDVEALNAQRIYTSRTGLPAFTARPITGDWVDEIARVPMEGTPNCFLSVVPRPLAWGELQRNMEWSK